MSMRRNRERVFFCGTKLNTWDVLRNEAGEAERLRLLLCSEKAKLYNFMAKTKSINTAVVKVVPSKNFVFLSQNNKTKITFSRPKRTWNDYFRPKKWLFCPECDILGKLPCVSDKNMYIHALNSCVSVTAKERTFLKIKNLSVVAFSSVNNETVSSPLWVTFKKNDICLWMFTVAVLMNLFARWI